MISTAIAIVVALVLAMPPLAGWFSATMPRHQLIQVPAMVVLGAVAAKGWKGRPGPEWDPALLVIAVGIMMFWMVPRSLDAAASGAVADQLLHISWFMGGAILSHSLPRVSVVVPVALGIHAVAMLFAVGLVYMLYPGLICTAYNLEQQRMTGRVLFYVAPALGVALWGWILHRMASGGSSR